jgi:hypothetical protein
MVPSFLYQCALMNEVASVLKIRRVRLIVAEPRNEWGYVLADQAGSTRPLAFLSAKMHGPLGLAPRFLLPGSWREEH